MFRALVLICLIFILTVPTMAQDGYPLPDDLEPIASDNAIRLQQLASVGSLLQGQLLWSPDGTRLVVGTSADTRLYNAADFSAAPIIISDAQKNYSFFGFNAEGELVINGQRWNVETGELIGAVPPPVVPTLNTHSSVEVVAEGEELILELTIPDTDTITLHIDSDLSYHEIAYSHDYTYAAIVLGDERYAYEVQVWNLAENQFVRRTSLLGYVNTLMFRGDTLIVGSEPESTDPYGIPFFGDIWDVRTGNSSHPWHFPIHYSPDGELMALTTGSGISLWSDHELAVLTSPLQFLGDEENEAIFWFSDDGETLVSTGYNHILIWDVATEPIASEPYRIIETEATIQDIFYGNNGTQLVTGEEDGIIEIWDAATGERETRIAAASGSGVSMSLDGNFIRAAAPDNQIGIWDAHTAELLKTFPTASVLNSDWSMAAYWENDSVNVAYLNSQELTELTVIPNYTGRLVAFNPVVGWDVFSDDTITAYDLTSGEAVFSHTSGSVWFTVDGQYLLIQYASPDAVGAILDVYEVTSPQDVILSIPAYQNALPSPSAQYVAYMQPVCGEGGGGSSSLYDLVNDITLIFHPGDKCGPYSHAFTPDETWLAVGWDYHITLMNIEQALAEVNENGGLPYNTDSVVTVYSRSAWDSKLLFNSDGSLLANIADANQYVDNQVVRNTSVEVWRFDALLQQLNTDSEPILEIPHANQAVFSPDSQYLATNLGLWHLTTGEQVAGFNIFTTAIAFNSDGSLLATYSENTVTLWDMSVLEHGHGDAALVTLNIPDVQELGFNPDGTLLYIKRAGDVQVWGVAPR